MACFNPRSAWRYNYGASKGQMTFKRPWPPEFDRDGVNYFLLPCGKCVGCLLDRSRRWMVRLCNERKMHECACFLTLTYAPENLPCDGSLDKKHLQDFWKRLRAALGSTKIRYFAVGEYGARTQRPHYHAIVFGWSPPDMVAVGLGSDGDRIYTSDFLTRIWSLGSVVVGAFSPRSAAYVARYCVAKVQKWDAGDPRVPPYNVMSRRPGIGGDYFELYKDSLVNDTVVVDGRPFPLPRYYLDKYKLTEPLVYDSIKANRPLISASVDYARVRVQEEYRQIKADKLVRCLDE